MKKVSTARIARTLGLATLALSGALSFSAAHAQSTYPNKPIKFVVPYSAGTTTDVIARVYADKLGKVLGQNIIVDNKAGAGGNISAESVARAAPDGYTLTFSTSATHATNPALYKNVNFDPIKDFTHIALMVAAPNMLAINPKIPANNMAELIAYAKKNPGKLTYISAGSGTSPHMAGELLKTMAGIDIVHVPYKGGSPMLIDLIGGQVAMGFDNLPSSMANIRAGKVRALAVTTTTRWPGAPDIPTMIEAGVTGFDVSAWFGLLAPAGTPQPLIDLLSKHLIAILRTDAIKAQFLELGALPVGDTPAEFKRFIEIERDKWSKVAQANNIKL